MAAQPPSGGLIPIGNSFTASPPNPPDGTFGTPVTISVGMNTTTGGSSASSSSSPAGAVGGGGGGVMPTVTNSAADLNAFTAAAAAAGAMNPLLFATMNMNLGVKMGLNMNLATVAAQGPAGASGLQRASTGGGGGGGGGDGGGGAGMTGIMYGSFASLFFPGGGWCVLERSRLEVRSVLS